MKEPVWISRTAIEAIHNELIEEFDGEPGIRREELLDAAISRPKHLFTLGKQNLCFLAATYSLGIARNMPFHDANKKTAFMVAYVFLRINGSELVVQNSHVVEVINDLAAGVMNEEEYKCWLEEHLELEVEAL
ncbi:MAG: type II toxin-antitoxin system death-on-curing family toxin [Methyloligellaceae bacterium]